MFLDKVNNIKELYLGINQVLVELVYEKPKSNIVIVNSDNEESGELIKTEVIASKFDEIEVGDLLIEYRMMLGQNGMLKKDDRVYAIVAGHDIKLWCKPDNYNEDAKPKPKTNLITSATQSISDRDKAKMSFEANGYGSKYLNNK